MEGEREQRRSQRVALLHSSQREGEIAFAQPERRGLAAVAPENEIDLLRDMLQGLP